jgi:hypothetical protein
MNTPSHSIIPADVRALYASARNTMIWKEKNDGGHTSWSAAWEACLWARLGDRDEMWRAMQKISNKYVTPRLLSLHPPTRPNTLKGSPQSCRTCYVEKETAIGDKKIPHPTDRGMITADKSPVSGCTVCDEP